MVFAWLLVKVMLFQCVMRGPVSWLLNALLIGEYGSTYKCIIGGSTPEHVTAIMMCALYALACAVSMQR